MILYIFTIVASLYAGFLTYENTVGSQLNKDLSFVGLLAVVAFGAVVISTYFKQVETYLRHRKLKRRIK